MNKWLLHKQIEVELENVHKITIDAAQRAYDTAVAKENEAENKYDTLGLEASYLAHGQSKRVSECEADLIKFKKIPVVDFSIKDSIGVGALVCIEDEQNNESFVFLSPVAGGLKIHFNHTEITMITPSSPIGKAITGCLVGDEFETMLNDDKQYYLIEALY